MVGKFDLNEETGLKQCSQCDEDKSADEFGRNKASRDGLKYFCKSCVNQLQREWAEKNPERVAEARERQKERRRKAYELLRQQESQGDDPSE